MNVWNKSFLRLGPGRKSLFVLLFLVSPIYIYSSEGEKQETRPKERRAWPWLRWLQNRTGSAQPQSQSLPSLRFVSLLFPFFEILRLLSLFGRVPTTQVSLVWGGLFIALMLIFSHHDSCPPLGLEPGTFFSRDDALINWATRLSPKLLFPFPSSWFVSAFAETDW